MNKAVLPCCSYHDRVFFSGFDKLCESRHYSAPANSYISDFQASHHGINTSLQILYKPATQNTLPHNDIAPLSEINKNDSL